MLGKSVTKNNIILVKQGLRLSVPAIYFRQTMYCSTHRKMMQDDMVDSRQNDQCECSSFNLTIWIRIHLQIQLQLNAKNTNRIKRNWATKITEQVSAFLRQTAWVEMKTLTVAKSCKHVSLVLMVTIPKF